MRVSYQRRAQFSERCGCMAWIIHLNKGLFGTNIGEITDDGRIFFPDGLWGSKVVGYLYDDGIYVDSGLITKKKIVDIAKDGNMYLTHDEGLFTHGTWVGSIRSDGKVFNTKGENVVDLTGDEPLPIHDAPEPCNFPCSGTSGGVILFGLFAAVFVLVAVWVSLSSFFPMLNSSSISDNSKTGLVLTVVVMGAACGVTIWRKNTVKQGLLCGLGSAWVIGALFFTLYFWVTEGHSSMVDLILLVLGSALFGLGWAIGATVVVGVPLALVKKLVCGGRP